MFQKDVVSQNPFIILLTKLKDLKLLWIISFSFLVFLGAQISLPVQPVPFTLQTFFVLLAGAFLGSRNGTYSMILYLCLGIIGLPVFANFGFGFARIFGPTGGYLLSFPLAAYLVGYIIETRKTLLTVSVAMLLGNFLVILFGALYLSVFFDGDLSYAFYSGAAIFSIWGLAKVVAAIGIYSVISNSYNK